MVIVATDLLKAEFLNRPNRFIANVKLGGQVLRCHMPNPGRMKELLLQGATCFIELSNNPNRKTKATFRAIVRDEEVIQLDSNLVSRLIPELIKLQIRPLKGYEIIRNEIPCGNHRFDYLLRNGEGEVLVEVKSTTLVRDGVACFPDAVSERASAHLQFLVEHSDHKRVMVIFVVYRNAKMFTSCKDIDPKFSDRLKEFVKNGEIKALLMETKLNEDGEKYQLSVEFKQELPVLL